MTDHILVQPLKKQNNIAMIFGGLALKDLVLQSLKGEGTFIPKVAGIGNIY